MNNDSKMDFLLYKKRKLKLFRVLDLFIRIIFTIVGTVSLVTLIMFLNSYLNVNSFYCFLIAVTLPNIYSAIINVYLGSIDDKIKLIQKDINGLEEEYKLDKNNIIKSIEIRFEGLSNDRKMELLNYIKYKMINNNCNNCISNLENDDVLVLLDENEYEEIEESIYSRKRGINNK